MGDWGLKVTKATKAVTSTTPEDYVFSSSYSTVKIIKTVESSVTVGASTSADVTIRHDLGFIPMVLVYSEPTPGSGRWFMGCTYSPLEDTYIDPGSTYVDNINLVLRFTNRIASSKVVDYYVYIFADPI